MDALTLLRTMGGLAAVLGLLAFALWVVRRFDLRLPGRVAVRGSGRRLELVERTSIDARRSVALLRRDGREHLILLSPEGNLVLETSIIRDEIDAASQAERDRAEAEAMALSKAEMDALRESFAAFVDRTRTGVIERVEGAVSAAGNVLRFTPPSTEKESPTCASEKVGAAMEPGQAFGTLIDLAERESRLPTSFMARAPARLDRPKKTGARLESVPTGAIVPAAAVATRRAAAKPRKTAGRARG